MVKYDGHAIVTGGARGMGAAICRQLAADGYDIVCNYISTSSKAKVEALAAEIREKYGHKVIAAQGDVSRFEDCQKVVQTAVDTLGEKIGVLVNNAGITIRAELADMSQSEILRVMNTNLMAGIYMCRLVLPYMYRQNSGSIVNITSVGGMTGFPRQTTYCAAKWGMNGLTKALAKEAGPRGIRVNAVAPGFIHTPMTDKLTDEQKNAMLNQIAMKRYGEPEEIASVVSFLASEDSSYVTGQVIEISGGLSM